MKIAGLDEAGRGPLAGPLVAAAAILKNSCQLSGLNDSKKLDSKRREALYEQIIESGSEFAVEVISARQINNKGIGWANKEIFKKLIKKICANKYIIDGNLKLGNIRNKNYECVINADATIDSVMAASIIAKVTRDRIMKELHKECPLYKWNLNMGYGTKKHIEAIKKYGMVKQHRDVFVTTALKKV